jgi:hypothetical protein
MQASGAHPPTAQEELKMEKQTIEVGTKDGKRTTMRFTGEIVAKQTHMDDPGHDSRGSTKTLYAVESGKFRVLTHNWSHWRGEESSNYDELSELMDRAELIALYGALASKAGIQEEVDLD